MTPHFLYKIRDVLEDLNYLNWVQRKPRTEEEMEKETGSQGGLCWSLTGLCCKTFVQVGFLRKSRPQNTVLVRFYGLKKFMEDINGEMVQ